MNRSRLWMYGLVGVLGVLLITAPIYALQHQKSDPKEVVKLLGDAKMTLAKAIEAAEKESKGTAIRAWADKADDGLRLTVNCVVGDTVQAVQLDKAGKVLSIKPVGEDRDSHRKGENGKEDKPKQKP